MQVISTEYEQEGTQSVLIGLVDHQYNHFDRCDHFRLQGTFTSCKFNTNNMKINYKHPYAVTSVQITIFVNVIK
jgi:hypothetical protein